jgi:hypothetical protein
MLQYYLTCFCKAHWFRENYLYNSSRPQKVIYTKRDAKQNIYYRMSTKVHETEPKQSELSVPSRHAFYPLANIYIKFKVGGT